MCFLFLLYELFDHIHIVSTRVCRDLFIQSSFKKGEKHHEKYHDINIFIYSQCLGTHSSEEKCVDHNGGVLHDDVCVCVCVCGVW